VDLIEVESTFLKTEVIPASLLIFIFLKLIFFIINFENERKINKEKF